MIHAITIWVSSMVMLLTIVIWWNLLIIHGIQVGSEMMLDVVVLVLFGNIKNSVNLCYVVDHAFINLSSNAICN